MARVAGSPEARKAWLVLRGPYAMAYFALAWSALVIGPTSNVGRAWAVVALLLSLVLLLGSFASFMVTACKRTGRHWQCIELTEVTGLQALAIVEFVFFGWSILESKSLPFFSFFHLAVAGFSLGVWRNMTWHKSQRGGGRE